MTNIYQFHCSELNLFIMQMDALSRRYHPVFGANPNQPTASVIQHSDPLINSKTTLITCFSYDETIHTLSAAGFIYPTGCGLYLANKLFRKEHGGIMSVEAAEGKNPHFFEQNYLFISYENKYMNK